MGLGLVSEVEDESKNSCESCATVNELLCLMAKLQDEVRRLRSV